MKGKHLNWFKNILDGKRALLESELNQGLRQRGKIGDEQISGDVLDRMMDSAQREIMLYDLESKSQLLRNILEAQGRIAGGTYGTCVYCGDEIGGRRLEAVPWTRSCISCQEQLEQNRVGVADVSTSPHPV